MNDNRKLHLRRLLISRLQMNKQANEDVNGPGLYRVASIEEWTMGQTYEKYESTAFNHFFNRISSSRLFDSGLRSNDMKSRYYRKPAQHLAAAMALSAYIESDMEDGVKQLEQCRNGQRS